MKYNLHTHSFYCRHGEGTINEYVQKAKELKMDILGFSEHCPYPDRILEDNFSRMFYPNKPKYERDVITAKEVNKDISIFLGYECDLWPEHDSYIIDTVNTVDYAVLGVHFLPDKYGNIFSPFDSSITDKGNLKTFTDTYLKGLSMGIFLFGAHPDVFMYGYKGKWDKEKESVSKDIITAAIENNMPLEINCNGIIKAKRIKSDKYYYPCREFWEMAKDMGVKCIKNYDAHTVESLGLYSDLLDSFIEELQLNMIEPSIINNKLTFN